MFLCDVLLLNTIYNFDKKSTWKSTARWTIILGPIAQLNNSHL